MVIPPYIVTAKLRTFEGHDNGHFLFGRQARMGQASLVRKGDISARADRQSDVPRHSRKGRSVKSENLLISPTTNVFPDIDPSGTKLAQANTPRSIERGNVNVYESPSEEIYIQRVRAESHAAARDH
jgi:hypothetical protein